MRCYICSGPLGDPKIDRRDGRIMPCSVCQEVVWETLRDYDRDQLDDEFVHDLIEPIEEYLEDAP